MQIPNEAHRIVQVAACGRERLQMFCEALHTLCDEVEALLQHFEVMDRDCCRLRNTIVPWQFRVDGVVCIDFDPIALACAAVGNAELELPANVDEVGGARCLDHKRNIW